MIYHIPARNGPLRPEMTLHARKLPLRLEITHSWPEMTAQSANKTGRYRTLPSGKKKPLYVFFSILYSAKMSEMTAQLVSHSR